ncbi:MAG TPA: hypothetical protein PKN50_05040, partial [Spirochaetota bacterium]|nr:hypothetical protein [Spirochaetota bacterium]
RYYPGNGKTVLFWSDPKGGGNTRVLLGGGRITPLLSNAFYFSGGYYNHYYGYFMYARDGRQYLELADRTLGPCDKIMAPVFSRDFSVCLVEYTRDGAAYVNIGGKEYGPYEGTYGGTLAEKDPGRFYFKYRKNGNYYYNINGTIFGPYDWYSEKVTMSATGRSFAVRYGKANSPAGAYVNYNGKVFGPYHEVSDVTLNADDSIFYFSCTDASNRKRHFINGSEIILPAAETDFQFICSHTGGRYAYTSRDPRNGEKYIHIGRERFGPYWRLESMRFSGDGRHYAFDYNIIKSKFEFSHFVVVDGKTHGPYTVDQAIRLSPENYTPHDFIPDTRHSAYCELAGRDLFRLHAGGESYLIGRTNHKIFDADTNQFAFTYTADGRGQEKPGTYVRWNGRILGPFGSVSDLKFSPGRKRLLFNATEADGKNCLYVDGARHHSAHVESLIYSSDESLIASHRGRQKDVMQIMYDNGIYGPFQGPYISYGIEGRNRLIVARYDPATGKVTVEEPKLTTTVFAELEIKSTFSKISALHYLLNVEIANTGDGDAKNLKLFFERGTGSVNIRYPEQKSFNLKAGERKTFNIPVIVEKIEGPQRTEYLFWFQNPDESLKTIEDEFVITIE